MLYVYWFANKKILQYSYSNLDNIIFNTKYETRSNAHRRYSLVGQETEVVSFLTAHAENFRLPKLKTNTANVTFC